MTAELLPRRLVILYARVSTDGQTLDVQRDLLLKGLQPGDEVVRDGENPVFEDFAEWSGTVDRPALTRVREHIRRGGIVQVRTTMPDRLMRADPEHLQELAAYLSLLVEWEPYGVIHADATGHQYSDGSGMGNLMNLIRVSFDGLERAKIVSRMQTAKKERAAKGQIVTRPRFYWLAWNPAVPTINRDGQVVGQGAWELKPEEAEVVRRVVGWVTDGETCRGAAKRLTELGIATPRGGKGWNPSTIIDMMNNPALKGEYVQHRKESVAPAKPTNLHKANKKTSTRYRPESEWLATTCPALITPEEYTLLHERMDANKGDAHERRRDRSPYLLTGFLECAYCGRAVIAHRVNGGRGGQPNLYYACSDKRSARSYYKDAERCTESKYMPLAKLESEVWQEVSQIAEHPEVIIPAIMAKQAKSDEHYRRLEQERTEVQTRLGKLASERDHVLDGYRKMPEVFTLEVVKEQHDKIGQEEAALTERLADLNLRLNQRTLSAQQVEEAVAHFQQHRDKMEPRETIRWVLGGEKLRIARHGHIAPMIVVPTSAGSLHLDLAV